MFSTQDWVQWLHTVPDIILISSKHSRNIMLDFNFYALMTWFRMQKSVAIMNFGNAGLDTLETGTTCQKKLGKNQMVSRDEIRFCVDQRKKMIQSNGKNQTVFFALWDSVDRLSFQGTSKHRYMIMFYPLKCRVSIRFCPETIQVHVAVWSPFSHFWWIIWRPLGVISSWRENEWECHKTTHVMKRPWDHAIHTQQKKGNVSSCFDRSLWFF